MYFSFGKTFLVALMLLLSNVFGIGQEDRSYTFLPISVDDEQIKEVNNFFENNLKGDSLFLLEKLDSTVGYWRSEGYYSMNLDSLEFTHDTLRGYLYVGNRFTNSVIYADDSTELLLSKLKLDMESINRDGPVQKDISNYTDKVLEYYEENGYPFANISLEDLAFLDDTLSARLRLVKNKAMVFDTFTLEGSAKISSNYLQNYLGIKEGDPYSSSKILRIADRIKNVRFLSLNKNPTLGFFNSNASVKLDLKQSKSSSFDFIIGLLRNNNDESGYIITGEFTAEFLNKLGQGERIYAQFQRLRPETQELNLAMTYPYVFGWPFGLDGSLEIYRNTDDFLNVDADAGVQYYFDADNYVRLFYDISSSSLLEIDTLSILSRARLPDQLDVSYTSAGVNLSIDRRDYRNNASKGYAISANAQVGFKNIKENLNIQNLTNGLVDFSESYDTINLQTYQIELGLDASYFIPLASNVTIKTASRSAYKFNEDRVYENEFFRIGGNRLLRGFDEQSIRSTFYSVLTAELRFLLAQEAGNFTLALPFVDYAWEYNPIRDDGWDNPIGVGIGMNFETGAGLFNFAIASGKRQDLNFEFNNLKIHFGYLSLF